MRKIIKVKGWGVISQGGGLLWQSQGDGYLAVFKHKEDAKEARVRDGSEMRIVRVEITYIAT